MNKYHRGKGEVVVIKYTPDDLYKTDDLEVTAYCDPQVPIGFLDGYVERYQVLEPVPDAGELEWVTRGKEEYDKCSAPIMESICEVCGGEFAIHNKMNQACPKDKNAKRWHTEYRKDSVFTYHHACCRLFLVKADEGEKENYGAIEDVYKSLTAYPSYRGQSIQKMGKEMELWEQVIVEVKKIIDVRELLAEFPDSQKWKEDEKKHLLTLVSKYRIHPR